MASNVMPAANRGGRRTFPSQRRGVAILVVLGLICMTLALSYAMLRSQGTSLKLKTNQQRMISARQATVTGLTAAVRRMHDADWPGVGTMYSGNLGEGARYEVTYTTGDASLAPGDADFADWPYRVTLLATGYATDPDNDQSAEASHQIRAVVRLVRRKLGAVPSDWQEATSYTVYQWRSDVFKVNLPCRLEGPLRLRYRLTLNNDYAWLFNVEQQYLGDLNARRLAGIADDRPLTGPIDWPNSSQIGTTLGLVTNELAVSTSNASSSDAAEWDNPCTEATYRIFPGGEEYSIPRLGSVLENISLSADPQTNPLGVFYCTGSVEIRDNVQIDGLLTAGSDIQITGQNVRLQGLELPPLDGASEPVRLQAAYAGDDLRVHGTAGGSIQGLVRVTDEFEIMAGSDTADFDILGTIATRHFEINGRTNWALGSTVWSTLLSLFQLLSMPVFGNGGGGGGGPDYFPDFVADSGQDPEPRITVRTDPTPHVEHWLNSAEPLYAPHPDDPGLRWDLIEWTESPPG